MADEKVTDRYGNSVTQDQLLEGKSESEQKAIRYFYAMPESSGCFSKNYVSDEDYLSLVDRQVGSMESRKARALSRLGLDEDQVREIPPVCFQGFAMLAGDVRGIDIDLTKVTSNNRIVTPTKELTWLFFGNDQVYVYKARVDMIDSSLKSERTQEYFYKDVTAFASANDSVRTKAPEIKNGCGGDKVAYVDRTVERDTFRIVVPGDQFDCALSPEDDNDSKISAMKQKLREKKTQ